MTKNISRVQPADALVHRTRRRLFRMATLAAGFALFALYVAWHEAHGPGARRNDELAITQAHADGLAKFSAAFEPFYNGLTADQKKAADAFFNDFRAHADQPAAAQAPAKSN